MEEEIESLKITLRQLQIQRTEQDDHLDLPLDSKINKRRRWPLRILVLVLLAAGISGSAYAVSPEIRIHVIEFLQQLRINSEPLPSPEQTESPSGSARYFYQVASKCPMSPYAEVQDDGQTLVLRGYGADVPFRLSFEEMKCFFRAVAMPEYIEEEMLRTRAIDGTVRATFAAITASWTYHPDNGLFDPAPRQGIDTGRAQAQRKPNPAAPAAGRLTSEVTSYNEWGVNQNSEEA